MRFLRLAIAALGLLAAPAAFAQGGQAHRLAAAEPLVLNYLGYAQLVRRENVVEAERLIRGAHRLAPTNSAITDSLGWALFLKGEREEAINLLEQAAQGAPADVEINEHLGDAYFAAGRRAGAGSASREADRANAALAVARTGGQGHTVFRLWRRAWTRSLESVPPGGGGQVEQLGRGERAARHSHPGEGAVRRGVRLQGARTGVGPQAEGGNGHGAREATSQNRELDLKPT